MDYKFGSLILRAALLANLVVIICGCQVRVFGRENAPSLTSVDNRQWAMYQGTASHNAVVLRPHFVATWKFDAGSAVNSGIAVIGDAAIFDTFGKSVVAVDIRNGKPLWTAQVDNIVMSTPIVSHGLVFIGTGHNDPNEPDPGAFPYASRHGSAEWYWGRPDGDHVIAFDLATGMPKWSYRTLGEDMPSPALQSGVLIFANGDFHAYGLDPQTGRALWRTPLDGIDTMASATPADSHTVLSICTLGPGTGRTLAIEPRNGSVIWSEPVGNCDSSPTVGEHTVFVSGLQGMVQPFGFGGAGTVFALALENGRRLWNYTSPHPGPFTEVASSERAIAGTFIDGMYLQSLPTEDEFVAFDAHTGSIKWRARTQAPVKMSAVSVGGIVYFGDTAGLLYSVDLKTGHILRIRMFEKPFSTSPPVVVGNTLLIVNGHALYAIPLALLH